MLYLAPASIDLEASLPLNRHLLRDAILGGSGVG